MSSDVGIAFPCIVPGCYSLSECNLYRHCVVHFTTLAWEFGLQYTKYVSVNIYIPWKV